MNRKEKSPCDKCKYQKDCTIYADLRIDHLECRNYKRYRDNQIKERRKHKIITKGEF